ncbi:MAG: AAA family ATPase [Leptonema sp. (in: Bacteria)]|nr:AAA family ATPase [Leptonema sp. (in: bacteria)]
MRQNANFRWPVRVIVAGILTIFLPADKADILVVNIVGRFILIIEFMPIKQKTIMSLDFESSVAELIAVKQSLTQEEKAERDEYADRLSQLSFQQKKSEGFAIGPLRFAEATLFRKERWKFRFEHDFVSHRISSGAPVRLYRDEFETNAILLKSSRSGIEVVIDEYFDFLEEGKVLLEASFPDLVWRDMNYAIDQLIGAETQKGEKGNKARLRDKILGYDSNLSKLEIEDVNSNYKFDQQLKAIHEKFQFNDSQLQAIEGIVATPDFAVVHGPPGTGKTTTLVSAIASLVDLGESVLVCAATNAAVDLLALKLDSVGVPVLRIGHAARVDEQAQSLTIDGRLESSSNSKLLSKYRSEAAELYKQARRFRRNFGPKEKAERDRLYSEYRSLLKLIRQIERSELAYLLERTPVICATLTGANHTILKEKQFDTVIIDEASQALEPACYIPLLKGVKRFVVAGDHHQLSPMLRVEKSELNFTLFEKMIKRHFESGRIFFLDTQYRMEPEILSFSNRQFYENKLKTDISILNRQKTTIDIELPQPLYLPFTFIDTAGADLTETKDKESESRYNISEAKLLVQLISLLAQNKTPSIGLIAPYKQQVDYLLQQIEDLNLNQDLKSMIEVDTVDSFQGSERDWIGLSLTRSNDDGEIGFLSDLRRINVAMTRARYRLIMIGDSATLSTNKFYSNLIDFVQNQNSYVSVWESPLAELAGIL